MKKTITRIVIGLLALVIIAATIFYFKLNSIIRRTIQTQATQSLELKTTLDSAHLSLWGGRLKLSGLAISSPAGFEAPSLLTLDEGSVQVRYGQLRDDPIHIPQLTLEKPSLVIEQAGGKLNFQDLVRRQLANRTQSDLRVIIDQLNITGAKVVLRPGFAGMEGKQITVDIPDLTLRNIGNARGNANGAALKQVVVEVVMSLVQESEKSSSVPEQLKGLLDEKVQQVKAEVEGKIQEVGNQLDKAVPGLGTGGAGKLGGQLQKLLDRPGDDRKHEKE